MVEAASLNGSSQTTLEERFSALEAKFAALEKDYHALQEKVSMPTESSVDKSTETSPDPLPSTNGTTDKADGAKDENTLRSRVKIVINKTDLETGERKDYPLEPPVQTSPASSKATDTSHAFTLRRNVYDDGDDNDGQIDIVNLDLWELLKELLRHYPYHTFRGPPSTLNSPYEPLILYWDKLVLATQETPKDDNDKQARADLKLLLDTISNSSGDPKLDKYFRSRDCNNEQNSVTFETLWRIFPPGTLVYGQPFLGQDQLFIVKDNLRPWPYLPRGQPYEDAVWFLHCWTYDWDGKSFRRMCLKLEFEYFDGQKPITSLPYHPFELKEQEQRALIKGNLIKRGVEYRQFCTAIQGSRMFEYNGEAMFVKKGFSGIQGDDDKDEDGLSRSTFDPEPSGSPKRSASVDSRAMVDFESYFRYGPLVAYVGSLTPENDYTECVCADCRQNEGLKARYRTRFDEEAHQKGKWEDEQYLICPPRVLGYLLRDKQWAQLQVSVLRNIPDNDPTNSWVTRLKLADGDETKNMILDLVKGHGTSDLSRDDGLEVDDIIARKGKGLVILLYGPPGVGKTSTAETVAIAARKPLFSISVADVGTKAKHVEANLAKIFALATSWQAVLLIDEADVFLESRGKGIASNTERNALVSVFLRVLEYYQGIMMLTTNQIAQFDVAVQSRIQVAIKYVNLNKEQTMAIFEGFLEPLAKRGLVKDMEDIRSWLKEDVIKMGLDGRQIRNIITSSLSLARAQGKPRLEKRHLKTMLGNVKDFKDEFIKQFEKYKSEQQGMIG